jgi:hypothetical protein
MKLQLPCISQLLSVLRQQESMWWRSSYEQNVYELHPVLVAGDLRHSSCANRWKYTDRFDNKVPNLGLETAAKNVFATESYLVWSLCDHSGGVGAPPIILRWAQGKMVAQLINVCFRVSSKWPLNRSWNV